MAIKDMGKLADTSALEKELAAAKGKSRNSGPKLREVLVEQRHLPPGETRFRVLPPTEGLVLPWVRFEEHQIFNDTAIETEWKYVSFNCPNRMSGNSCYTCDAFLPRLESSPIPGAKKMGEKGFPKTQVVANVEFTMWGGGPVPEDKKGIRPFKFGRGIWRGGDKNQVGGMMGLLQENPNLASIEEGVEISLIKEGAKLDTTYKVTVVKTRTKVDIGGGRFVETDIPAFSELAPTEAETQRKLDARVDLKIFLRMKTQDDMMDLIAKVNPLPESASVIDAAPAPAPRRQIGAPTNKAPAAVKPTVTVKPEFQSVQDEIDGDDFA